MNRTTGSLWAKWDLHVHTPASIVQHYGGDNEATWEKFFADIENLPPEFKVLGINDYLFIDGYKKVLKARSEGRMKNIEAVFPVIEIRIDKFGGSAGHLSRVNFHIIFSDQVKPETIESQFINALSNKYQIEPAHSHLTSVWSACPTRDSLIELGQLIIQSVPEAQRGSYGHPLIEGFNNLNFSLDKVIELLNGHYFKGKYLTAIGKTEWSSIKWNDHSIAEKKNIINAADFVFISSDGIEASQQAKSSLAESGVNSRLLDCSDAHRFSDSPNKDRIGKCFTWIKANSTFLGLQQVLNEPEDRVFIGDTPAKHLTVESNKTKYIRSLAIYKKPESSLDEAWFNQVIDFNHGLIAIIGNKGNGKSALSDIIGLLGNSRNCQHSSFLNDKRFKKSNDNKATHFIGKITWESGASFEKNLGSGITSDEIEKVKYIPQNFFEHVCNEVATEQDSDFDRELKKTIFSHVGMADRLGHSSLEELLDHVTGEIEDTIDLHKEELDDINEEILALEKKASVDYKNRILNQIELKKEEIKAHEVSRPNEPAKPDATMAERQTEILASIAALNLNSASLASDLANHLKRINEISISISKAEKALAKISLFERQFNAVREELSPDLETLGVPVTQVIELTINSAPIHVKRATLLTEKQGLEKLTDPQYDSCLIHKRSKIEEEVKRLQEELDGPNKQYELYKAAINSWESRLSAIVGNESTVDTLKYFEALLAELDLLEDKLTTTYGKRLEIVSAIFQEKAKQAEIFRQLYQPVQEFITNHPIARSTFPLRFAVSIIEGGFEERFFDWISQSVSGTFCGKDSGREYLRALLSRTDFNNEESVRSFVTELIEALKVDKRGKGGDAVSVESQLRKGRDTKSLYSYICSLEYVRPKYLLKMGEKELNHLSPGEKGALLLIFYFLVDKGDIPLIIDQPEENLDNQTIYNLLVPCVKEAKRRRQIFVVTHNPNLAVVCDAEQVICASIDKANNHAVEYVAGAIENPTLNKKLLDVLEGTRPAFDNRNAKYHVEKVIPKIEAVHP